MAFRSYVPLFLFISFQSLLRGTETFSISVDATSDQRLDDHPINEAGTISQPPPQFDSCI